MAFTCDGLAITTQRDLAADHALLGVLVGDDRGGLRALDSDALRNPNRLTWLKPLSTLQTSDLAGLGCWGIMPECAASIDAAQPEISRVLIFFMAGANGSRL